jgi:protease-4
LRRIGRLFRWTWKFLTTGITVLSSLILLVSLSLLLFTLLHQPTTEVPDGAALVFAPRGNIVEKKSPLDPMTRVINRMAGVPLHEELLRQDVIDALRAAADDDRIKLLVLAPDHLKKISLDQARDIGAAIEQFKNSGKVVLAMGDSYNQGQYYLASWSDEIYLNPMGSVGLQGFGVFRLYMRDLLDRLAVNVHVFKVGSFKSALEPFLRNDMSPEAREANRGWLSALWNEFCKDIGAHRGIPPRAVTNAADRLAENLRLTGGDGARAAINNGLVDGLKTREEMRAYLRELVGADSDGSGFRQINLAAYLSTVERSFTAPLSDDEKRVGIITARGNIVYGEGGVNEIGSDDLCKQIRRARKSPHIKALVLRVDSGGGSAFASELIRQELLLTREAGKPVVISMGSMAASGAYWISADADKIFASPMTLTGSIGIFGALPTFENTLQKIGVSSDGIGTTSLAGAGDPTRALPENFVTAMQTTVEHGYRKFIDIVAKGRKMDPATVEKIAEGRVWDGVAARKLGLVDEMGTLEDAVAAAAELAGLPPDSGIYIRDAETPAAQLFKSLGAAESSLAARFLPGFSRIDSLVDRSAPALDFLLRDDPRHLYGHCLLPPLSPFF